MAEVKCTKVVLREGGYLLVWEGLQTGDVGDWQEWPSYPVKTISIEGVVESMRLEGRNRNAEGAAHMLTDADGHTMSHPGLYLLTLNPWQFRPFVDSGKDVTVTALLVNPA